MSIEKIITAEPRGFCAGVARSIKVVEDCLEIFGAPVYVKHAIVHNKTVVADLEGRGAITVEEVNEISEGATAVFSAHGSPPEHYEQARARGINVIDATCPLVTKVHIEILKYIKEGKSIVYVGHRGHIEGKGVLGEAKKMGVSVPLVDNLAEVDDLEYSEDAEVVILTQTTLSVDETEEIIEAIKGKYKNTIEPPAKDICYATTNRQAAIKDVAEKSDIVFVVGSVTSSNSNRLVEVAKEFDIPGYLIDSVEEIQKEWLEGKSVVGLSAGASAPEHKVKEVVDFFVSQGATHEQSETVKEDMHFVEPRELTLAREGK